MPKASPATSTLYYPLTPLPESFRSLHPRLPLLPSLSLPPSLPAQVGPESLSGPPSIPIRAPHPLTTSHLPPLPTQSLSLAATLRMTRLTAPLALGYSTSTVAPRAASARGATGLSRQVAAKLGVTGLASARRWGALLVKAGTVIRCCPLATPRTLCVQRNVVDRHQCAAIEGSTAVLPQYSRKPPPPPHAASPCASPSVRHLRPLALTPFADAPAAAGPPPVWITEPSRQQCPRHRATTTPGCPGAALGGARAPLTVAPSQLLNLWSPLFLCPQRTSCQVRVVFKPTFHRCLRIKR